ncbi:hypothetical protein ElyMa_003768200 [Elysia marginata]|uniref:Uncharacterized protein n=1 Tax=Elysia marginata TaxID=1093978 RepID=A0AAV4FA36_9GAST|nr:hypothetical protein ElyMa_003768200 [Elysia marginata]
MPGLVAQCAQHSSSHLVHVGECDSGEIHYSIMNSDRVTHSLMQRISRVLKKVVSDLPRFQTLESEGKKQIDSLVNLLEQRHSVQQVCLDLGTPDFADLQFKLLVKISSEVNSKAVHLKEIILPLKDHHDVLSRERIEILRLLKKHGGDIDPKAMCEGTPLVPPIEVMLLWIDQLEIQLRELYPSVE